LDTQEIKESESGVLSINSTALLNATIAFKSVWVCYCGCCTKQLHQIQSPRQQHFNLPESVTAVAAHSGCSIRYNRCYNSISICLGLLLWMLHTAVLSGTPTIALQFAWVCYCGCYTQQLQHQIHSLLQ
jgi:hypothetical protein